MFQRPLAVQYQDCQLIMNKFVLNTLNDLAPLPLSHISLIIRFRSNCLRPLFLIGQTPLLVFNEHETVIYVVVVPSLVYVNHHKENLLPNLNIS